MKLVQPEQISILLLLFYFYLFETSLAEIRKCCKSEEMLNVETDSCVKGRNVVVEWNLSEYFQALQNMTKFSLLDSGFGRPHCNHSSQQVYQRKLVHDDIHVLPREFATLLESPGNDEFNGSRVLVKHAEFCIDILYHDGSSDEMVDEFVVEICLPRCSVANPCLRKCCDPHQTVDVDIFACDNFLREIDTDRFWEPSIDDESIITDDGILTIGNDYVPPSFHRKPAVTHIGDPACKLGSYDIEFGKNKAIYNISRLALLQNASLLMEFNSGETLIIPWNEFCIDGTQSSNLMDNTAPFKNGIAFVCNPVEENQDFVDVLETYRRWLYPILTGTSSVFLLITAIIYTILLKDLNLPGWLQFSYTNSLFVAFVLLTVVQLLTQEILTYSKYLCKVVGYTLHASFLSCFFWLTSMNIDLWLSFRSTSIPTNFGRNRGKKRYFGFALVSICTPIAVTVAAIITDIEIKKGLNQNSELFTGIGETGCALNIQNFIVHLCYFYLVVGLLLGINVMFFFCTVLCLRERQRETRFAHRQCTAIDSADLLRFRLFTRLFFVMGILWVFELISWVSTFLNFNAKIQTVFVVTDCLNALQGVAVFFMFLWKPQTWRQLKKKWRNVFESQASLMGANTIKTSVKSSTKSSRSSCKATS